MMEGQTNVVDLLNQKAQELFKICDQEDKGFICKRDMQRMLGEISLEPEQLESVFDSLDVDGNGFLTLEEFANGFGTFLGVPNLGEEREEEAVPVTQVPCKSSSGKPRQSDQDEEEEFLEFIVNSGAVDIVGDNDDAVRQIWQSLRGEGVDALTSFTSLLREAAGKVKQASMEQKSLESALKHQQETLQTQIQNISEEMEAQIAAEKHKAKQQLSEQEVKVKENLESQIALKDLELRMTQKRFADTVAQLEAKSTADSEHKNQMVELEKQKEHLERQIEHQAVLIEELRNNVTQTRANAMHERKRRAMAAFSVTENIAQEREDLVRQLDVLKSLNAKLLDDKDTCTSQSGTNSPQLTTRQDLLAVPEEPANLVESDCEVDDFYANVLQGSRGMGTTEAKPLSPPSAFHAVPSCHKGPLPLQSSESCLLEELAAADDRSLETGGSTPIVRPDMTRESQDTNHSSTLVIYNSGIHSPSSSSSNFIRPTETQQAESVSSDVLSITSVSPQRVYKVIVVGDAGVGKSCIVQRICSGEIDPNYATTIGVDFRVHTMVLDGKTISIQLWDTAGQERYRSITKQYFRKADGVFVTFDVTSENSFKHCRQWIECVQEMSTEAVCSVLLGNKHDLCPNPKRRVITSEMAAGLADRYSAIYVECSAVSCRGIAEAVNQMARMLVQKEDNQIENAIKLIESQPDKKKCCK